MSLVSGAFFFAPSLVRRVRGLESSESRGDSLVHGPCPQEVRPVNKEIDGCGRVVA